MYWDVKMEDVLFDYTATLDLDCIAVRRRSFPPVKLWVKFRKLVSSAHECSF